MNYLNLNIFLLKINLPERSFIKICEQHIRGRKTRSKQQGLREKNEETWNQIENNKTGQTNISREIRTKHGGNKKSRGEFEISRSGE